jgi:hypothetical protein
MTNLGKRSLDEKFRKMSEGYVDIRIRPYSLPHYDIADAP